MTQLASAADLTVAPRVAVIGCGHWGKNLVRVLARLNALVALSDADEAVATTLASQHNVPAATTTRILADPSIDAVVIAVPAALHYELCREALEAGKHVFVEKPLALSVVDAEKLCALADERGLVLMVGHLLQYHPAFLRLRQLVDEGALGRIQYLYSNRLNLGRFRREENILWSFAPHDISMILSIVGSDPDRVSAQGAWFLHKTVADVTVTHLSFPGGEQAHVFVSWLHPYKEQKLVVVGDQSMAVFDDGQPWESKLRLYRSRVAWQGGLPQPVTAEPEAVDVTPSEPLDNECRHFLSSVASRTIPRTDGREGLRVLRVLQAAEEELRRSVEASVGHGPVNGSDAVSAMSGVMVHQTAYVDEGCEIGAGTRIWHFSHILKGSVIGRGCNIGQNVVIGPNVVVGARCKIQNNVSLYEGVELGEGVFCGPSCVFTNVTNPRAEISRRDEFRPTKVGRGATIGANATIVCGNRIGDYAFIAAGAVVTDDVPAFALMMGVPARRVGWVSREGERLGEDLVCPRSGSKYREVSPDVLEEIAP